MKLHITYLLACTYKHFRLRTFGNFVTLVPETQVNYEHYSPFLCVNEINIYTK
jgi:hypothetical protein